jgi:cytochrome c oxidase cbb3-type subunit IV
MIAHETALWLSKYFGLLYLIAMSAVILVYVYWPANKATFDAAAKSILDSDETGR